MLTLAPKLQLLCFLLRVRDSGLTYLEILFVKLNTYEVSICVYACYSRRKTSGEWIQNYATCWRAGELAEILEQCFRFLGGVADDVVLVPFVVFVLFFLA